MGILKVLSVVTILLFAALLLYEHYYLKEKKTRDLVYQITDELSLDRKKANDKFYDAWGNPIKIEKEIQHKIGFVVDTITSAGRDGEFGTDDDINAQVKYDIESYLILQSE